MYLIKTVTRPVKIPVATKMIVKLSRNRFTLGLHPASSRRAASRGADWLPHRDISKQQISALSGACSYTRATTLLIITPSPARPARYMPRQ
jgi:hypothetical protein